MGVHLEGASYSKDDGRAEGRGGDHPDSSLIAIVAHELRVPLVPIRNAAALLKHTSPDPATVRRAAEIIERQASSMHRLIGDLVDVSRLQLGGMELRLIRAPLNALIDHAVESAGGTSPELSETLLVSVSSEPVFLQMDVLRLSQALHNIIANAIKFTPKGGQIYVRAQRQGSEAVITVTDTGVGIPVEECEAIFSLFVQLARKSLSNQGLGIGLYLARHFVNAHGGSIVAWSAGPGLGSEFTLRVPCELPQSSDLKSADVAPADDRFPS